MKITDKEIDIILHCPVFHKFFKQNKTGLICFRLYHRGFKPKTPLIDSGFIYNSPAEAKKEYRIFMDKIFAILDRRVG
jgi:hypothetical protein